MVITRTPFRMSFFGGGTDFPGYYEKHGGAVLSTSFDKYCYVTIRHLPPFFDYANELLYSVIERVPNTDSIKHPAIREAMKWLDMHEIRLVYEADLPARTGLGTSSSFAVGMLNAFYAMKGKYVGKQKLADDAIYLERVLCNEAGGVQDQIAASFGGLNRIDFNSNGYNVSPLVISSDRKRSLNEHLMLFYTGISRFSADIQESTQVAIKSKEAQLAEMHALVDDAVTVLTSKSDIRQFGGLLHHTWTLKRSVTSRVSNDSIDGLYAKALQSGALGGKLLGAGGGGFLLFFVEPEKQERVKKALDKLLYVPFEFENDGATVLHYAPEMFSIEEAYYRKQARYETDIQKVG
ncbi:galactokinase [Clostridia bacterium]|nr:galactokinase [Clostridia bacterium]